MTAPADILCELRDWTLSRRAGDGLVPVVAGLDLTLRRGRWLAVLGANGSGKSSLLRFLAGEESPLRGSSALVFQDPDEQLIAASVARELAFGRPELDPEPLLREFGLAGLGALDPRVLSAGQKQRLALATALGGRPDLLLCDEPTSLQDAGQATWVLDRLDRWRRDGGALVTATCDRREVERADDLLILDGGRPLAAGPRAELAAHPAVTALLDERTPAREPVAGEPGPPLLELADVACAFGPGQPGFAGVTLRLGPGQRVGLTGPNGCGKSTLLAACAGARAPQAGRIRLQGRELYRRRSRDLDHGLALLAPQFPEYLFCRSTVAEEIALDPALAGQPAAGFLAGLDLPADLAARNPHAVSSGQRRRLALGLVLGSRRPVLLLDEPTAALDGAGRRRVLDLLDRIPQPAALVIASHDHGFLTAAGCRILELTPAGLIPA